MKHLFYTTLAITALLFTGCADAGKSQTVTANTKVYFDVSGVKTDLGGKITKYNWELTGEAESLYDIYIFNNGSDHASFIAPDVSKEAKLTFKLTSIESYKCKTEDDSSCKHRKSTDKVKITVTPGKGDNNSTGGDDRSSTVTLSGKIKTLNNVALAGAIVNIDGEIKTTRNDGSYRFDNLKTDERAIINVTHPSYFSNTRIVLVNQKGSYAQDIKLDKEHIKVAFAAQEGHSVSDNHASINFEPGEYINTTGKKYIDNVNVTMSYHNFKRTSDTSAFVGSYETTDGTNQSALLPHGFMHMSISDSAGDTLKVHSDTIVKLAFPVTDVSTNDETIPLWFYNKKLGYWLQEGTATRINNQYIAQVNRMGTWGLFSIASKGSIQVCVNDAADKGLSGVNIRIAGDKWSSNLIQTDSEGMAVINTVRADVKLKITASKLIGSDIESANYSKSVTLSAGDNINLDDCIVLISSADRNATKALEEDATKKKEEEAKAKADREKAAEDAKETQLDKDAQAAQKKADEAKEVSNKAKEAVIEAKSDLLDARIALSNAKDTEKVAAEKKVKTAEETLKRKETEATIAKDKATLAQDRANQAKEKAKR